MKIGLWILVVLLASAAFAAPVSASKEITQTELEDDIFAFLTIVLPTVFIFTIGLVNRLKRVGNLKLFYFFGVLLANALVPTVLVVLEVASDIVFFVFWMAFIAGMAIVGRRATDSAVFYVLGGILSLLVFPAAVTFATFEQIPFVSYPVFLLVIGVFCFLLAFCVGCFKKRKREQPVPVRIPF